MKKEIKCKICGCVLAGIIVLPNFPVCEGCIEYIHHNPHAQIEYEELTQQRNLNISGLSGTAINSTTSSIDLDFNEIYEKSNIYSSQNGFNSIA